MPVLPCLLLSNRREECDGGASDQQQYSAHNASVIWQFANFSIRNQHRGGGFEKQGAVSNRTAYRGDDDPEDD